MENRVVGATSTGDNTDKGDSRMIRESGATGDIWTDGQITIGTLSPEVGHALTFNTASSKVTFRFRNTTNAFASCLVTQY